MIERLGRERERDLHEDRDMDSDVCPMGYGTTSLVRPFPIIKLQ